MRKTSAPHSAHKPKPSRSRLLALEPRYLFDGVAIADAPHDLLHPDATQVLADTAPRDTTSTAPISANNPLVDRPVIQRLFQVADPSAELLSATASAAQMIQDFLKTQGTPENLSTLFSGQRDSVSAEWLGAAEALRQNVLDGKYSVQVQYLSDSTLRGALGAFAAQGANGQPAIYINRDWVETGAGANELARVLIEELGHSIDAALNPGSDTMGDEGQLFSALVRGADASAAGFALDNDHATLQIGDESENVELATYNFVNVYRVNTDTTPAGKESNSHDFVFTSLGAPTIDDGAGSRSFSGNDVSATGINIGGTNYYGWISRPIKVQGEVKAFYFWTDTNFTTLAAAQADGNMDGDRNVTDNSGFILVVDQNHFNSLGFISGSDTLKNIGSSSDRADSALNSLLPVNVAPVAVVDMANSTPGQTGGAAVEAGGLINATAGNDASGNVLTNDTDANTVSGTNYNATETKTVTLAGTSSATQAVAASSTSASNGTAVTGQHGSLTIGADGSYNYIVNNSSAAVEALRTTSNTLADTFTYTMADSAGATSTTTLTVTIQGANDNPDALNDYNVAKETTTIGGSGFAYTGATATGNVLGNDTDVDRNSETKLISGLTINGAATIGTVTVNAGTASLSFAGDSGFTSVSSNQKLYVLINGTYRAVYASDGTTQVSVASKTALSGTNNWLIGLNATPGKYYDAGGLQTISSTASFFSTNAAVLFENSTAVTENDNGGKTATVAVAQTTGTTTLTPTGAITGTVAVGMSVSGAGVSESTIISSIGYTAGVPTSIVLNKELTSTAGGSFTFTSSVALGQTLTGAHGTLVLSSTGSYTYTPTQDNGNLGAGQSAVEAFDYTMLDASGATDTATLYITVFGSSASDPNAVNDTAIAVEAGGVNNGTAGTNPTGASLLTNDTTPAGSNTILSARAAGVSAATSVATDTSIAGLYGTLTVSSTGAYTYTVDNGNATVQALRDSSNTLTDVFVYTVQNTAAVLRDSATLTVTINGANDTPIATNDAATAVEASGANNTVPGYNPSGNVLSNDADIDDAASELRVTAIRNGSAEGAGTAGTVGSAFAGTYGSLTLNANGTWTYAVDNSNAAVNALAVGSSLTESFNYTVTDRTGTGLADIGVLAITIQGASDTVAVNSVFVNEVSPYAVFTVSGGAGVSVTLALGNTTGLATNDVTAALSGAGADIGSTLQYYHATTGWTVYSAATAIPAGGQLFVRVAVNQDNVHEGNESFTLTATTVDNSSSIGIGTINDEGEGDVFLTANNTGTANASGDSGYPTLDDDRPTISITSPTVTEGATTEFTVSIDKTATADISFIPSLNTVSAALGTDTALASTLEVSTNGGSNWSTVSGAVTIAAGQTSVKLRIATTDDATVEPSETFTLTTGYISGTVKNLPGVVGTASITDNDAPTVTLSVNNASIAEAAGTSTVTATLSNVATTDTVVTIAPTGTATGGGTDYTLSSTTITIAAGQTTGTATITAVQDTFNDDGETAIVAITAVSGGDGATENGDQQQTVTITDDDSAPTVTLSVNNASIAETAGTSIVTATLSAAAATDTIVTIAATGTATGGGTDYTLSSTTITIAAGQTTGTATITAVQDAITEGNETVIVDITAVSGGNGATESGTQQKTVTITDDDGANQPSVMVNDSQTVAEDNAATGNVLTNDSDVDDTLTVASFQVADDDTIYTAGVTATLAGKGTLTIAANGAYSFTPVEDWNGAMPQATYTVNTGSTAKLDVTVTPVNDPTNVTGGTSGAGNEDTTITGTLTATDVDGLSDGTVFAVSSDATHGTASIDAATGAWSYTPVADYNGSDSFTVTLTDDAGNSSTQAISLTVAAVADIANDTLSTSEDTPVTITAASLLGNDSFENGAAAVTAVGTASNGTISLVGGNVTYTPNANYNGADSFSYTVTSPAGITETATVNVTVTPVNDAATIGGTDTASTTEDSGNYVKTGTLAVSDVDSATSVRAQTDVAGIYGTFSIDVNGAWTYTADNAKLQPLSTLAQATETFTIATSDGTTHDIAITLNGVNDAATFGGVDTASTTEDSGSYAKTGTLAVSDVDSATTVTVQTNVAGTYGTFSIDASGAWTYTADNAKLQPLSTPAQATETFTIATSDGTTHDIVITLNGIIYVPAPLPPATPTPVVVEPVAPPPPQSPPAVKAGDSSSVALATADSASADAGARVVIRTVTPIGSQLAASDQGSASAPARLESTDRGFPVERVQVEAAKTATVQDQQKGGERLFVYNGIKSMAMEVGQSIDYRVPKDAFGHTNNAAIVQLEASLSDGAPLPEWMDFDPTSGTFSGKPPANATGTLEVKVTARDDQGREVTSNFKMQVEGKGAQEQSEKPAPGAPAKAAPGSSADAGEQETPEGKTIRLATEKSQPAKRGAVPFSDQLKLSKRDPLTDRILSRQQVAARAAAAQRLV